MYSGSIINSVDRKWKRIEIPIFIDFLWARISVRSLCAWKTQRNYIAAYLPVDNRTVGVRTADLWTQIRSKLNIYIRSIMRFASPYSKVASDGQMAKVNSLKLTYS